MIIGPPHHITCVTTAIWKFMYVHIRTKITSLQVSHSVSPMETLAHGWIWWCPCIHTCTRVQLTTELTYSTQRRNPWHMQSRKIDIPYLHTKCLYLHWKFQSETRLLSLLPSESAGARNPSKAWNCNNTYTYTLAHVNAMPAQWPIGANQTDFEFFP